MNRRQFTSLTAAGLSSGAFVSAFAQPNDLIASITPETIFRNRDGKATTWFHPRVGMLPDGTALMTMQYIRGSDYFGPVHYTTSKDLGKTWTEPEPIDALGRVPEPGHDGLEAGVCDVVPQHHPATDTTLAMGHVVFYRGPRFSKKEQLPRYPVYAVREADGSWGERKILAWDDPRGGSIYSNGCGQRLVDPSSGDIIMSMTFGVDPAPRAVAGVRCSFDGKDLKIREVGPAIENQKGRGLLEPSVTHFADRYWMTMRAEDNRGYVATSTDGLHYDQKRAWSWDDGTPLNLSTTQQHWLTHSDGLYLVYTREDEANQNVIRWRAPLYLARVDPDKGHLIRDTEQVVIPMHGDGINDPDKVPLMGNFHVTNINADESWVTVGEWLPRGGAKGDTFLSRIKWSQTNQLVAG